MLKYFFLLFCLSSSFSFALQSTNSKCEACTPPSIEEAFQTADLVLSVSALNFPTQKKPIGRYQVKKVIKKKKDTTVPKIIEIQATFKECKRGLFLPPGQVFVVFLNADNQFHLLPCKALELIVDSNKVIVEGHVYKVSELSRIVKNQAELKKKSIKVTPNKVDNKNYCIKDSDCTFSYDSCLVHRCECPEVLAKSLVPVCKNGIKRFSTGSKTQTCLPCSKKKAKCISNLCRSR